MKPTVQSPYLTASEAAAYLRLEKADGSPNLNALYILRWRHGLKAVRRGGRLLFKVSALDAFLEDERSISTRFQHGSQLPNGKVRAIRAERIG